jgi:membrane-associated phospholipid phosphatase
VCTALLLVLTAARGAGAQAELAELRYEIEIDLPIVIGGAVVWLASEFAFKAALAPDACRWCELPGIDRSVRDALKWNNTSLPDTLSGLLGFGLVPAVLAGTEALIANHDGAIRNFGPDVLIVAEAAVIATNVNQFAKFIVGRERPFVHALSSAERAAREPTDDDNLSFYSGHTTAAFATAVAAGTVASMRGYRWAPLAWIVGLALAVTTAYLRIAADRHYFTDVLTGAVVGSAFGFTIPYFFHGPRSERPGVSVGMLGSNRVVLSGAW